MVSHLLLQSEAGVFAVEVVAAFGKSLVTLGVDADAVQVVAFIQTMLRVEVHLSAKAGFLQGFYAQLASEMSNMGMVIAQKHIVLCGHRVVQEGVAVIVHLHKIVAHVAEKHNAVVFPHLDATVEVEIRHQH